MVLATSPFGSTGHVSSRLIFGAAALGGMSQERADATIGQVWAAGINHFDTASSYGESELRLAPWLVENRSKIFLATKVRERSGPEARGELERSLERLGVDQVDLIQLHNLVEEDEWQTAHRPGGALEALVQARDEGMVRFIGVTGHGTRIPAMHLRSLAEFDYASVLFPYNSTMLASAAYRDDVQQLLQVCAERSVAVQTIKSIARGRWPEGYDGKRFSWYEPLEDPGAISRATAAVLANPQLFLNTTSDARKLDAIFAGAQPQAVPPTDAEIEADIAEFGITPLFDGLELERI
jgi:aryl-alcohol dehydrogenase-like predicted oxidoreductase